MEGLECNRRGFTGRTLRSLGPGVPSCNGLEKGGGGGDTGECRGPSDIWFVKKVKGTQPLQNNFTRSHQSQDDIL